MLIGEFFIFFVYLFVFFREGFNGVIKRTVQKFQPAETHTQIPLTATTEQRMISAAVFAALNEAWDGFKRANGL